MRFLECQLKPSSSGESGCASREFVLDYPHYLWTGRLVWDYFLRFSPLLT